MKPYIDTNFLTRWYLPIAAEPTPESCLQQLQDSGSFLPVTWLHRVELINALELHVYASRTLGRTRVTREMAMAAQARFRDDCAAASSLLRPVVISLADWEAQFEQLCIRHTAKRGFRTYDLLHVSVACLLGCDRFWSYDAKASKLAELEGLKRL